MAETMFDAYNQEIELTDEQQACVKYMGDRTLMVKGYAGAGKSVVLMAIAKKYLEKYKDDEQGRVAIFTFQNTLVSATQEILDANNEAENAIVISTVNSFVRKLYEKLAALGYAPKRRYPFGGKQGDAQRIKNVEAAIKQHKEKYGSHRFHNLDVGFWVEEFDWMKDMDIWKDDIDLYQAYKRRGRGNKVRFSAEDYIQAFQIYRLYCEHLDKTGQGDWADQTLFLVRNQNLIPEKYKFDHILVDEAQDLSLAQMKAVIALYRRDMVVAMDANQRIHGKNWTPKLLGINSTTKKLTKSMRTTKQIDALAESVRSKNDEILPDDDKNIRAIPVREGNKPRVVHLQDSAAEKKFVVTLIQEYLKVNPNITIGVIASKNKQLDEFSSWMADNNIHHQIVKKDSTFSVKEPGVKLATAFGAKGLEFNVVIIPNFAEGFFPYSFYSDDLEEMQNHLIKMRNIVYVSMTRAKNDLTVTYWGNKGSRFIADMTPELYQAIGDPVASEPAYRPKRVVNTPLETTEEEQPVTARIKTDRMAILGKPVAEKGSTAPQPQPKTKENKPDLAGFFKSKGLEVIDKRSNNGCLWVVGDKESLDEYVREAKKEYNALGTYSEKGGNATKHRPGWFTKCQK